MSQDDPYEDHELRDEWNEFKYYTDGVTTARMQRVEIDGEYCPCVKVFMRDDASQEAIESVYDKADDLGLVRWKDEFEEEEEHIFVLASSVDG